MKFKIYSILIILLFISSTSFSQESTQPLRSDNKTNANLIHFGDLIDVDVLGSAEFDWRGTINPEGFLDGVDFVEEPVYALCRSEESVAEAIAKGFSKFLRNPKIVVKILDRSGRAVSYLYGAVKNPQRFQIERPVRLSELLILSGGIDEKASGEIQILRTNSLNCQGDLVKSNEPSNILVNQKNFGSELVKLKISEIIKGGQESNPIILNGDMITVAEADPIYIIGGVVNPRKIFARLQMTVSRAIASAGGLSKNADLKNIVIYRRNKKDSQRIEVDYEKIKNDVNADLVLQKFDILQIGEIGINKSKFSPIIKIIDTQTKPLELPLRIID